MRRGTTPEITINVKGISIDALKNIEITFEQNGIKVVKTDNISMDYDNNTLSVWLSQDETLMFNVGIVSVQVRAVLNESEIVIASKIRQMSMEKVLNESVLE